MSLKILWQDPLTENVAWIPDVSVIWDGLRRAAKKTARADTEIVLSHVEKDAGSVELPYLGMLNATMMVDEVIKAEREGYDAAMMMCYGDPGLQEARGAVDMPVTGAGESGMLIAQLLGNKFAAVTDGPGWVPVIEENMRRYGFGERAIKNRPVRHFEVGLQLLDAFRGKAEELIALFEAEALKCVEDGADVVIAGCAYVGPALSLNGYREVADTGIPVVDATAAAIKLAESLADLRQSTGLMKSHCPTSLYATPRRRMLDHVRKDFGFD